MVPARFLKGMVLPAALGIAWSCQQQEVPGGTFPGAGPLDGEATTYCWCPNGSYYNNQAISSFLPCGMQVCGKDLISYQCVEGGNVPPNGVPALPGKWVSNPVDVCSDLACPGSGTHCGSQLVNGEPAALYECPGNGLIPLSWTVCAGACNQGACGPEGADCPCLGLNGDFPSNKPANCGDRNCAPSGVGDAEELAVCTVDGWKAVGAPCEGEGSNACTRCKGVQDSEGREVTTTQCGKEMCGLGIGNHAKWICSEDGWLNLGIPCERTIEGGESDLGTCPAEFRDSDGKIVPVEPFQTFCGAQSFPLTNANKLVAADNSVSSLRIRGKANTLYSCQGPGAAPKVYTSCNAIAGGSGICQKVSSMQVWYEGMAYTPEKPNLPHKRVHQWDQCDERCPPPDNFSYAGTGRWFCGQHRNTGRFNTLFRCVEGGEPVPLQDCPEACAVRSPAMNDVCVLHGYDPSDSKPAGTPSPPPPGTGNDHCDDMYDYQGNLVPSKEARLGKMVCGPGGQIYICRDRAIGRPDGWEVEGTPCGSDCSHCGVDAYGQLPYECIDDNPGGPVWELPVCDDSTFEGGSIPCNDDTASDGHGNQVSVVGTPNPAYCGDNPSLHAPGDPKMLYHCEAICPAPGGIWEPCNQTHYGWNHRQYHFVRSEYCPLGCQITPPTERTDRCLVVPGSGFAPPLDDYVVLKNFGRYDEPYGGWHLGEDGRVNASGPATANAAVKSIGDGTVVATRPNGSQYLAIVLIKHYVRKSPGSPVVPFCSFYGHLNPDSFKVAPGDVVRRGDVIATVAPWMTVDPEVSDNSNSHLHATIIPGAWCDTLKNSAGAPCGYDDNKEETPDVDYNTPSTAPFSVVAKGECDGSTFYSLSRFLEEYGNAKVCAKLEDCQ